MPRTQTAPTPSVLIAGHVTRDVFGTRTRLGGAAAFAALAASCLGVRTTVVTAAPRRFALLTPLANDPQVELIVVPTAEETSFHLSYGPTGRALRLAGRAAELSIDDVPKAARALPLAFVAPVIGECDRAFVEGLGGLVVAGIQGWLRTLGPNGAVLPALSPLVEAPPNNLTAAVFSELDHPEADALAVHLARRRVLVALTRGKAGVSLFLPERIDVPAAPATEVDPTGAGDVFGLVFGMALADRIDPVQAAQRAVVAAARVVEGPGVGNLAGYFPSRASPPARPTHWAWPVVGPCRLRAGSMSQLAQSAAP